MGCALGAFKVDEKEHLIALRGGGGYEDGGAVRGGWLCVLQQTKSDEMTCIVHGRAGAVAVPVPLSERATSTYLASMMAEQISTMRRDGAM